MAKDNKPTTAKIIFPRLRTAFVWLNRPNTKWKAEGKYECTVIADPADEAIEKIVAVMEKVRDEAFEAKVAELKDAGTPKAKAVLKKLHKADIGAPELNDDAEETGNIKFRATSTASGTSKKDGKPWTRSPALFDAKGKKLDNPPNIFAGSEVKMAVTAASYYKPDNSSVGCTLYLDAVQIIKLVSGSGDQSAEGYGFGEEDGFEADDSADTPAGEGSNGDDDDGDAF